MPAKDPLHSLTVLPRGEDGMQAPAPAAVSPGAAKRSLFKRMSPKSKSPDGKALVPPPQSTSSFSSDDADEVRQEGEAEFGRPPLCHLAVHPEPFLPDSWSEPAGETFRVRGPGYLSDRVKEPAAPSLFRLLTADIIEVTSVLPSGGSLCLHPGGRLQSALRRARGGDPLAFPFPLVFCVNIRIPHSTPGREYHIASYYAVDDLGQIDGTSDAPHAELARRFFFGGEEEDEFRHNTFKFLPRIVEGNTLVRKAVGAKPVIMGRKLKQSYVRGQGFFELIIDVGSDKVANKIVKMSIGYSKSIVVDMAFILEGKKEQFLPERVLGSVRLKNIDFKKQRRLVEV
mmetsp:Transcript_18423/g.37351  ORF Transcript_18423/g.37351 Transcript_18423/m.37351 type:complete len:342 (-) Transcript_18423:596-1621(-)